ncbi:NAD-dependent epimerase/dehydratase family protein [uncultured Tateyamaria sp.]|uniref:NAD-dependent epimerase/dehydratase family protein n=1 Tax=Tateyamaria sp. 1078 TaxID=3417464 RepID=UPI0026233440|nr:NAD-dependent epimerase/dehydratase family protein [uncultured Tateyamaria sp.]
MTAPLVVLGAGGKLGRLMAGAWPDDVVQYGRADLDILDHAALMSALRGARAVLCLAGCTNGSGRPMSLNTTLAQLTLGAAAATGCGRVFLMSSAAVYGRQTGHLSEATAPAPVAEYGQSKLRMEQMAADHSHPCSVLRLGNVAGADAILGGWQPGFALDVLADGTTPRRSYIGPRSLVRVLYMLSLTRDIPPLLNIAAPGTLAMGDLLDAAGLAWTPRTPDGDIIAKVTLDTSLLSTLFDWQPDDSTAKTMVREWKELTHRT